MLPRGITGFAGAREQPPVQDIRSFAALAYAVEREISGAVRLIDSDIVCRSFYSARIETRRGAVWLLGNAYHPYAAFADSLEPGRISFTDAPSVLSLEHTRVLTPAELYRPWSEAAGELGCAEMEQILYWKPHMVGEVIFNFWD